MTVVAIHQPNYLPWLGYFAKIAEADIFVFLDDVQYSKNSYINRVKVLHAGAGRWLTLPVSFSFGDAIDSVSPAQDDWAKRHLDGLKGFYRKAPCFRDVWPDIEALYRDLPPDSLAAINMALIERISDLLALTCQFERSSQMALGDTAGDDRLVRITDALAPGGTYLSGSGGDKYQEEATFAAKGITLAYRAFDHPAYTQAADQSVAGLSVIDAAFHLGWRATAELLTPTGT